MHIIPPEHHEPSVATPSASTPTPVVFSPHPCKVSQPQPTRPFFPINSYGTRFKAQAAEYLMAQYIFQDKFGNPFEHTASHIYRDDRKRETVDSLLKRKIKMCG